MMHVSSSFLLATVAGAMLRVRLSGAQQKGDSCVISGIHWSSVLGDGAKGLAPRMRHHGVSLFSRLGGLREQQPGQSHIRKYMWHILAS